MQVVHYLQRVNFTTGFGDHVSFDKNGSALAIYDVMNWKPNTDGSIDVQTVGVVDESAQADRVLTLDESEIFWNFETKKVNNFYATSSQFLSTVQARIKLKFNPNTLCHFCLSSFVSLFKQALMETG